MKTTAIADVAWAPTIRTYQDGDFFEESNTDLVADDIADRLGYLKARDLESAKLAGNNAFTGDNTHAGTETFSAPINLNFTTNLNDELIVDPVSGALDVQGVISITGTLFLDNSETLADANASVTAIIASVPTLTADRTYTLPAAVDGRLCFFRRPRTADAFRANLIRPSDSASMGQIAASNRGWLLCAVIGGDWKVVFHSELAGFAIVPSVLV